MSCVSSGGEHHQCELCVEWGGTNTGWHINVHHVKLCTRMLNIIWDMEMALMALMGGAFTA